MKKKKKQPVVFRLASQRWLSDKWFSHRQSKDREILDLMSRDIADQVDPYKSRNWEIQSSVDGCETWQTQQNVVIAW